MARCCRVQPARACCGLSTVCRWPACQRTRGAHVATSACHATSQAAYKIDGVATDIVLTRYADKIFVVVTQFKKMGSLVGSCRSRFFFAVTLGDADLPLKKNTHARTHAPGQ